MKAPAEAFSPTSEYVRICGWGTIFIVAYNGQISGSIFSANMDKNAFKENLYFKLETTDESGESKVYTIPMEVTEITPVK